MYDRFMKIGEYFAAGFYEKPDASRFVRYSLALRRYLENRKMPVYNGETLYPCGSFASGLLAYFNYSHMIDIKKAALSEKDADAANALIRDTVTFPNGSPIPGEHSVGGMMYTHSHINFRRIIREGLNTYRERVEKMKNADMREGLLHVLSGIEAFHRRSLTLLRESGANEKLCAALEKVPMNAADTLYEALVAWNFVYYMDGCDNIGNIDADLIDFYRGEDMTEVLRCFFKNVDANDGWSGSLGPNYNELTLQCLRACKGLRRPSLELRVTPDMPKKIWEAATESIKAGGGSPSLYNEEAYQRAISEYFPSIPKSDLLRFCGGGCTETMLAGLCNVGSLDAGVNVALIFDRFMREVLPEAQDFDSFYCAFIEKCRCEIYTVLDGVSEAQKLRAERRPQPMRTLLIDDCIDKERDYNAGGARYYWSVINIAGLINVIDSMLTVKNVVFDRKIMTGQELITYIDSGKSFLGLSDIPRHGNDSDKANAMAQQLSKDICSAFDDKTPYLGGRFMPSSIQFVTYTAAGKGVGATPDGRNNGAPLCDSIGAIHGNDKEGITALLNSAASICQQKMAGTPVLNVKMEVSQIQDTLEALIKGYFALGGMQVQITCVNKDDLIAAMDNPESYPNLIVRIGGYSEYFSRLTPELRRSVVERTVYGS